MKAVEDNDHHPCDEKTSTSARAERRLQAGGADIHTLQERRKGRASTLALREETATHQDPLKMCMSQGQEYRRRHPDTSPQSLQSGSMNNEQ